MIKELRHILFFIVLIASTISANAITANEILANASNKYVNSKSISASFNIIDNGSEAGTITIAGNKFVIKTSQLSTWFDGKTQWSYSPTANEVNISEPTAEELQQINPFAIIGSFRNDYNAKLMDKNNGYRISLTPKKKNHAITNIVINFNPTTYFPSLIVITTKNNNKATIKIKSISVGNTLPTSTFTFNATKYPGVEIIDLR